MISQFTSIILIINLSSKYIFNNKKARHYLVNMLVKFYRSNDFFSVFDKIDEYVDTESSGQRNLTQELSIHTDYTHTFVHWHTVFMSSQILIGQCVPAHFSSRQISGHRA